MITGTQQKGLLAEIAFESRLVECGYSPICRPARFDDGVDFVVLTSKGWVGVQVKAHTRHSRGSRRTTHELRLDRGWNKAQRLDPRRHSGFKAYYASRGVMVFALRFGGGFYLVPLEAMTGSGQVSLAKIARYWEAWDEVLGEPGPSAELQRQAEIDQLDLAWRADAAPGRGQEDRCPSA